MKKERKMKKYSTEWKYAHASGWVEYHRAEDRWKIHCIKYDTEYAFGDFFTKKAAEEELQLYKESFADVITHAAYRNRMRKVMGY